MQPHGREYPSRWDHAGSGRQAECRHRHLHHRQSHCRGGNLSFGEREEIALLRAQGRKLREIARQLGCATSTISRELQASLCCCTCRAWWTMATRSA